MKHDIFEFTSVDMTIGQRMWRVLFLLAIIGTVLMDMLYWRP
jgi:hypothetical protein